MAHREIRLFYDDDYFMFMFVGWHGSSWYQIILADDANFKR